MKIAVIVLAVVAVVLAAVIAVVIVNDSKKSKQGCKNSKVKR